MFRKSPLGLAIAALIAAPICAQAEIEVSAELKNETAVFLQSGEITGLARTMLDDREVDAGEVMKFENSARIFINGDLGESSSWHSELRPVYDTKGVNSDYKGHRNYTQNDYLRELYADTRLAGWDLRLGKQQVVWGTADGIKLLDIINPTDFRELNQNAMEDSRIPVWMANAERNFDNGGNLQLIVSQHEENKIAGLNSKGDAGHPFIMKGVDAITGQVNGFRNITPKLASTAQTFTNGAPLLANVFNNAIPGLGLPGGAGLLPFAGFTVDGFASTPFSFDPNVGIPSLQVGPGAGVDVEGYQLLNVFAQCGFSPNCTASEDPNANEFVTNLMPVGSANPFDTAWNPDSDRTSAFEHMPMATFATFNTFSGNAVIGDLGFGPQPVGVPGTSATTSYHRDYPSNSKANFGTRFRDSLDNGLNYSVNYFYGYDANPSVDLDWYDRNSGEKLAVVRAGTLPNGAIDAANSRTRTEIANGLAQGSTTSILLRNKAGQYYGAFDPTTYQINTNTNPVELRFTETVHRTHNIGTSFDYTLDTEALGGVVLRGEFLYQKDTRQPVVDNLLLGIGDLSNGLEMQEADMFKYVIGADVTVLTNLLISAQFIQFRNLDYVDRDQKCDVYNPLYQSTTRFDCSRYTADMATMNPTNGLNQAEKNKEFYSLFLSKPFGPNQLGRVNNIVIYEEGGGWWDRLDAEYSLTDQLIIGGEINVYWGDEETTFGQFDNSSNVQVTLKYIIE